MEIVTVKSVISPGLSRADGSFGCSEARRSDFQAVLAQTESAASLSGSLKFWREPDAGAPPGMNSGAMINTFDRDMEGIPNVPGTVHASPNPAPVSDFHTVRPGETLYGISRKVLEARGLEVTPAAIMRTIARLGDHNGITDRNRIYPNQRINTTVVNSRSGKVGEIVNSASPGGDGFKPFVASSGNRNVFAPETCLNQCNALTSSEFLAYSNAEVWRESPGKYFDSRRNIDVIANSNSPKIPRQLSDLSDVGSEAIVHNMIALQESYKHFSDTVSTVAQPADRLPDIFYKGVIGKALDYLPMESEDRLTLQKVSSAASSVGTSLKLASLLGVASPIAAVFGIVWGIFSGKNIEPTLSDNKLKE